MTNQNHYDYIIESSIMEETRNIVKTILDPKIKMIEQIEICDNPFSGCGSEIIVTLENDTKIVLYGYVQN